MLHFRGYNILKFTQNSLVVLIPYLLIYSQQCFVTILLRHIAFMRNVFCFNGFNQTAIVLRYSAHIKPRKFFFCVSYMSCCNCKKSLKSVCIYGSHSTIKAGVPLFWTTQYFTSSSQVLFCKHGVHGLKSTYASESVRPYRERHKYRFTLIISRINQLLVEAQNSTIKNYCN